MKVSSSKENILKKIRQALANPVPVPFPQSEGNTSVFQPSLKELEIEFAENFTGLLGKFSFCIDEVELADQLKQLSETKKMKMIFCKEKVLIKKLEEAGFNNFSATDIATCDASITGCELLIARTGSIVMSSAQQSGRNSSPLRSRAPAPCRQRAATLHANGGDAAHPRTGRDTCARLQHHDRRRGERHQNRRARGSRRTHSHSGRRRHVRVERRRITLQSGWRLRQSSA